MHNLFGTDGIRRLVGTAPFTDSGLERLTKALTQWIIAHFNTPRSVLIGHDTRQSASWIKAVVKAGLLRNGVTIHDCVIAPTPAINMLVKLHTEFSAGIIISASHNPYFDNGIKIVDSRNTKLSAFDEQYISQLYLQQSDQTLSCYDDLAQDYYSIHLLDEYQNHIAGYFTPDFLSGIRIVIDCAHGAILKTAPTLLHRLGAQVITINAHPTGTNINAQCGAVYPQQLQEQVLQHHADIGFAFDGDGDRIIAVTKKGIIKNGDDIIALLLDHPRYSDQKMIAGTIVSNYGLEQYLNMRQIKLARTNVGDKYVSEYLQMHNLLLGGEQSGHIVLNDYLGTGDGLFTALRILETIILTKNWDFETFTQYPQITLSVPISNRKDLNDPDLANIIQTYKNQIESGRLIVRYSGTENLLRVMVEDKDLSHAELICKELAKQLQRQLL